MSTQPNSAETHRFEAETRQILDLVVHSFYSDTQVFLRELISNASDALDRARYEALHREDLLPCDSEPQIEILADKDANTLTVRDNGIGMTREEIIQNLGTIARSGTRAFVQAAKEGNTEGLIGKFGVGFYSVFMVADRVEVHSLSALPGSEPVRWSADGGDSFELTPGEKEQRGTDVVLHLTEDAKDFLEEDKLKEVIKRHSDFLAYPVRLAGEKVNRSTALWARLPSEIEEDEYKDFYKHVSGDWQEPATHIHFSSDGPLQFHSLLFVPKTPPFDLDAPDTRIGVKLYCRRVLVLEEARELLPRYLRFVRGVVESPDLDLNVSREILQKTPIVGKLKRQVIKRVLRRLGELMKDQRQDYEAIWEQFGRVIKEGIHEDSSRKDAIARLLLFRSTADKGWRSLEQVVEDMPEGQDNIWFLTGLDNERIARSPLLERFRRKGLEVLLMSDPVDEWVVMNLTEFDGKSLKSVAKGDIPDDESDAPGEEQARKQAEPLIEYLTELFKDEVKEVRPSTRLTDSPSVLVDAEHSLGHNLERILRVSRQELPPSFRILEINVGHPLIRNLGRMREQGRTATLEPLAWLLLDHARLAEGEVKDPSTMVERLQKVMLQASLPSFVQVPGEPGDTPAGESAPGQSVGSQQEPGQSTGHTVESGQAVTAPIDHHEADDAGSAGKESDGGLPADLEGGTEKGTEADTEPVPGS